jgi:hypothetical protein
MQGIFENLHDESKKRNDEKVEESQDDATLEVPYLLGDDLPSRPGPAR